MIPPSARCSSSTGRYELQAKKVPTRERRQTRFEKSSKTKRPPGNRRPFLSRENSSNGDSTVKTFWRNLMSRKRGVSRNFCEINGFSFNSLENRLTDIFHCFIVRQ